jgi:hypothetical protein
LIEHLRTLPNDTRIAVLAEADAVIERYNVDGPWSSSLINTGNRVYKYHLAVVIPQVLAHSVSQHVSLESACHYLVGRSFSHRDSRGCPCCSFENIAETLERKFGLTCSECKKIHPANGSLDVTEHGYNDWPVSAQDKLHRWSSGLCPTCWEWKRALALSKRRDVAIVAKAARATGLEIGRIDVDGGCVRVKTVPGRRKKPRKRRYSYKVMEWKAAHDALRELGIFTEDISDGFYRTTCDGDTGSHAANVESQVDTRPSGGVDKD